MAHIMWQDVWWPHMIIQGHNPGPGKNCGGHGEIGMFYFKWCYIRGSHSPEWIFGAHTSLILGWHDPLRSVMTISKGILTTFHSPGKHRQPHLQSKGRWPPGKMAVPLCESQQTASLSLKKYLLVVGLLLGSMTYLTRDSWSQIVVSRMGSNLWSGIWVPWENSWLLPSH